MGLPRYSPGSTTSSISCMPREHSSTGTWERVWKRENSLRPERISPPLRRTTRKSESRPPKEKRERKVKNCDFFACKDDKCFSSTNVQQHNLFILFYTYFIVKKK